MSVLFDCAKFVINTTKICKKIFTDRVNNVIITVDKYD